MKKLKGNIAESAVIYQLSKLGLPVFKELGDSSSVDIITLVDKNPITIQVKYAEINNNSISLTLRKTGPGGYVYYYQMTDFMLFALYVASTEQIVWINVKEALQNKNLMNFKQVANTRNNQYSNDRLIQDYLDFYKAINYASLV